MASWCTGRRSGISRNTVLPSSRSVAEAGWGPGARVGVSREPRLAVFREGGGGDANVVVPFRAGVGRFEIGRAVTGRVLVVPLLQEEAAGVLGTGAVERPAEREGQTI